MRINWWTVAKVGTLLLCVGLVASVRADQGDTHVDAFELSWPQLTAILGFVALVAGGAAELRRWMIDLDRRVARIEEHCEKEGIK